MLATITNLATWISKVVRLAILFRSTYEEMQAIKLSLEKKVKSLEESGELLAKQVRNTASLRDVDRTIMASQSAIISDVTEKVTALKDANKLLTAKHATASKMVGQTKADVKLALGKLKEVADAGQGLASGSARKLTRIASEGIAAVEGRKA